MMKEYCQELFRYRELIYNLTVREIKIRYKQTLLGFGWAVLQPLVMMVVFTVIFSRFLQLKSEGIPYPIFSYSALLFWTFFSTSLSFGPDALVRMGETIKKIYFPREIIPLSAIFAAFVDMLIGSIIFIGMMAYYSVPLSLYLFLIPLLVIIQIVFTMGVIFILSALNVYYRDIRHGIPFLVQLWMYATPIVYSMESVPVKYRHFYVCLNPMAGLIDGYRKIILHQDHPEYGYLLIVALVALTLTIFAYWIFKKMEGNFADVV